MQKQKKTKASEGSKKKPAQTDDLPERTIDKTLEDSFPTSDPPGWTTGRETAKPGAPQAPREKRAEPDKRQRGR